MNRHSLHILGLAVILFFGVSVISPVDAASPRVLIIYGSLLKKRVILSDWEKNHQLMLAVTEDAGANSDELKGRPYLELAFFWGPKWVKYLDSGKSVRALKPGQANQRGRFYPAFDSAPAVWTFESIPGSGPLTRRVLPIGINILEQYGIPVKLASKDTPNKRLQRTRLRHALVTISTGACVESPGR